MHSTFHKIFSFLLTLIATDFHFNSEKGNEGKVKHTMKPWKSKVLLRTCPPTYRHRCAIVLTSTYTIVWRKVFPTLGENCVRMVNGRLDDRSPSATPEEYIQCAENKKEKWLEAMSLIKCRQLCYE